MANKLANKHSRYTPSFFINIEEKGLAKIHRDWQVLALQIIWENQKGLLNREVWEQVNNARCAPISRSSIINFLHTMDERGVLSSVKETGKGGYRIRYSPKITESEYKEYIVKTILEILISDFPGTKHIVGEITRMKPHDWSLYIQENLQKIAALRLDMLDVIT